MSRSEEEHMDRQGFQAGSTATSRPGRATTGRDQALFSEDGEYRYSPTPTSRRLQGRDAIVDDWLDGKDEPGTYDAQVRAAGDRRRDLTWPVADPKYFNADGAQRDEYWNVYVCRFNDEGECATFTEYWMQNRQYRKASRDELVRKAKAGEIESSGPSSSSMTSRPSARRSPSASAGRPPRRDRGRRRRGARASSALRNRT